MGMKWCSNCNSEMAFIESDQSKWELQKGKMRVNTGIKDTYICYNCFKEEEVQRRKVSKFQPLEALNFELDLSEWNWELASKPHYMKDGKRNILLKFYRQGYNTYFITAYKEIAEDFINGSMNESQPILLVGINFDKQEKFRNKLTINNQDY